MIKAKGLLRRSEKRSRVVRVCDIPCYHLYTVEWLIDTPYTLSALRCRLSRVRPLPLLSPKACAAQMCASCASPSAAQRSASHAPPRCASCSLFVCVWDPAVPLAAAPAASSHTICRQHAAAAPGPAASTPTATRAVVPPRLAFSSSGRQRSSTPRDLNPEDVDVYEVSHHSLLAKAFGFMRIHRPAAPAL